MIVRSEKIPLGVGPSVRGAAVAAATALVWSQGAAAAPLENLGDAVNIVYQLPDVPNPDVTLGTAGANTLTLDASTFDETVFDVSSAASITINGGSFADDIAITSLSFSGVLTVNAGDGDDVVDGAAISSDTVRLFANGGDGEDELIGNDSPTGSSLGDVLDGGPGNDRIEGARGRDALIGGGDDDTLVWVAGDGTDIAEGGEGSDELVFEAFGGSNRIEVFGGGLFGATSNPAPALFGPSELEDPARVILALNSTGPDLAAVFISADGVETVRADLGGGTDQLVVNNTIAGTTRNGDALQSGTNLSSTLLETVLVPMGDADGQTDTVELKAGPGDDAIVVTGDSAAVIVTGIAGLEVELAEHEPADVLFLFGEAGDDSFDRAELDESAITVRTDDDPFFADGFESGDTGAWSDTVGLAGDECETARELPDETTVAGSLADKSGGVADSSCGGGGDTVDAWFRYEAPCTGTATVTTCLPGTTFDTVLSAFDGCGGTQIACNDDDVSDVACGLEGIFRKSTVELATTAGNSYEIRVSAFADGFGEGDFEIRAACSPAR